MLTQFSVKNYKCLADVTLPLTPIHVLIGQNDTGKTSLLEAIRAGAGLCSNFLHSKRNRVTSTIAFNALYSSYFPSVISPRELVWLKSENLYVDVELEFKQGMIRQMDPPRFACRCPFEADLSKVIGTVFYENIQDDVPKPIRVDKFRFRPSVMARSASLLSTTRESMEEDGFGLSTLLDAIKDFDSHQFGELESTFRQYFPRFLKIRLVNADGWMRKYQDGFPIDRQYASPGKRVALNTVDGDIQLQQASDGAILLLGFLALTYSPKPPDIVLIEEPENGIHPKRLIEVAKLLRHFVSREKNAPQIIMTTHSPWLLSEFQPEEVTLMRRQPDGSAKAFPLRNAKHLRERMGNDFYLGEMWYNLDEEDLLK